MKKIVSAMIALSMLGGPMLTAPALAKHKHHHRHGHDRYVERDYRSGYDDGRRDAWRSARYERSARYDDDYRYRCKKDSNTGGTILGAVAGGVLGNIIAEPGDKTLGTVIGGVAGGVVGNRIDDAKRSC